MPITVEELQADLVLHDKGVLKHGSHKPDSREFCALEFESIMRRRSFSDAPTTLPDLRPLNDARWGSDEERTAALLPVMAALWDWANWSSKRKQRWAEQIAVETVKQIIAELPGLSGEIKTQCQRAQTVDKARIAAWAAEAAEAAEAAGAAATITKPLHTICAIFIQAADDTASL